MEQIIKKEMEANDREFDTFDWDGESLPSDEEVVSGHEKIVAAAVGVLEQALPWQYTARSQMKQGAARIYKVKQVCNAEQQAWLREQYPGYVFDFGGMVFHHDHPVSHISTILNEAEMVECNILEGRKYVDIWGNISRCNNSARPVVCAYENATPKDYLRHHKNTGNAVKLDWAAMEEGVGPYEGITEYVMTHSLYYASREKIASLLRKRGGRLRALVHRHPHSSGVLNNGELKYSVSEEGIVTQVNSLTGEKYVHPSLEAMFQQGSCKTDEGGLAWTVTSAGGDAFFFEIVSCPNDICEDYVPFKYLHKTQCVESLVCGVKVHQFGRFTWTWVRTDKIEKQLYDCELLTKLRRYIGGKQRTPKARTELGNYARRLTNKDDIISIHGGGCHAIDIADVTDYVTAAFYMDVAHELEVACEYARTNSAVVKALNTFYEEGVVHKDFAALSSKVTQMLTPAAHFVERLANQHVPLSHSLSGLEQGYTPSFREGLTLGSLGVVW